ncbi:MAG: VOC family protein [Candidatus Binatia bacterium]
MSLRLDHIGIYVRSIEKALDFYCSTLGLDRPDIEEKPEHRMRLARVRLGDVELELIEAAVEDTMLRHLPHQGPGIYHIGVRVDSADEEMKRLRSAGVRLLDETPREGDDMRVVFVDPAEGEGVMVELVQRLRRRSRPHPA